jgi:hypothetical protein
MECDAGVDLKWNGDGSPYLDGHRMWCAEFGRFVSVSVIWAFDVTTEEIIIAEDEGITAANLREMSVG